MRQRNRESKGGRQALNKPERTDGMEGLMAGGKVREATRNKRGSRRGGTVGETEEGRGQEWMGQ